LRPFATGTAWKYNAGLDAKFGITNNMTLDVTVNPDFGQVEADPSEVNLTAYETFFQEKRPFFIEGNNITSFKTGIGDGDLGFDNLFYSRRIGRSPQIGVDTEENEYARVPRNTPIISIETHRQDPRRSVGRHIGGCDGRRKGRDRFPG
jgi:hypothetical protein